MKRRDEIQEKEKRKYTERKLGRPYHVRVLFARWPVGRAIYSGASTVGGQEVTYAVVFSHTCGYRCSKKKQLKSIRFPSSDNTFIRLTVKACYSYSNLSE
jgi:hypothetical protein